MPSSSVSICSTGSPPATSYATPTPSWSNKCDRVGAGAARRMVEEKIRSLNAEARLVRTTRSAVPLPADPRRRSVPAGIRTAGRTIMLIWTSDGFVSLSFESDRPFSVSRFQAFLDAGRPPGLFRGKGFLWLAETGKRYVFHLVGERFTLEEDERDLRRRQPPGADRTGPRCGNPASAPGGLPRPRLAAAPLLDVGGIGVAGGGNQRGGEKRRRAQLALRPPCRACRRASARRADGRRDRRSPRPGGAPGCRPGRSWRGRNWSSAAARCGR